MRLRGTRVVVLVVVTAATLVGCFASPDGWSTVITYPVTGKSAGVPTPR